MCVCVCVCLSRFLRSRNRARLYALQNINHELLAIISVSPIKYAVVMFKVGDNYCLHFEHPILYILCSPVCRFIVARNYTTCRMFAITTSDTKKLMGLCTSTFTKQMVIFWKCISVHLYPFV